MAITLNGSTGISSAGNVISAGNVTAGNILANNYYYGNGAPFSGGGNGTPGGSNTQIQFNDAGAFGGDSDLTYNKNTNTLALNGTLTALDATVYGAVSSVTVGASGNIVGGNLNTGGVVSATGNVRGSNINTTGIVSATGNITGGNINTAGIVSATGNVRGGNINTAGIVSATGNITGNCFIGNGSQLTGIVASANTGNVGFDNNNIYNTQGGGLILSNFNYVTAEAETAYINIPAGNSPGDLQVVQEQGNVTINANSSALWSFNADGSLRLPNNGNIAIVDNVITEINAVATANSAIGIRAFDAGGNTTASSFFDGTDGTLNFYSFNPGTDASYNWRFDNGGSFTLPNAPGNVYFGQEANQPVVIPYNTGLTISANRADAEASYINLDQNAFLLLTPGSIQIDNSSATSLGNDINLLSGDDIRLAGRNKPNDSESEGGDININAGQGADAVSSGFDTGGGGDIQIRGGPGGDDVGGGFGGSSGGFVTIAGGDGGVSDTQNAGSGGSININAGSAAGTGNTSLGGFGGDVSITAGQTTRLNEIGGSISLNTGAASGDGTGTAGYLEINIPAGNATPGGTWTFGGSGTTFNVPANSEIFGPNFGNFTVGCAGNTIVTSSDYGANVKNWVFGYTGNLLAPGNIITPDNFVGPSLRTNLTDFNWSETITNITLGTTTTITLANNVFGDPWTGQVTISDVTGTTEANATWWYEAADSNQFVLYTDSTLTTPVDSSAWTAYTGGGFAATLDYGNIEVNAQNITIKSDHGDYNNKIWRFDRTGQTVFPYMDVVRGDTTGGNITGYALIMGDGTNEAIISTPNGNTTYNSSQRLVINPGKGADGTAGEGGDIYLWAGRGGDSGGSGGDIKIRGGQGGTDNGAGGYIRMEAGDGDLSGAAQAGFVEITSGRGTGSFAGGYVRITGGQGGGAGGEANISGGTGQAGAGGAVNITGGVSGNGLAEYGNVGISSGASSWAFDNTGTLTFPSLANISGGNFNAGTASATVALNAFNTDGNTVSIQAQGNTSSAVISIFANVGPVTNNWVFTHAALDPNEAYLYVPGGASITTPNATGNVAGKNIFIEAGSADQNDFYTTAGGDLHLKGGRGAFNDGGGGGPGGDVNINAGESADPAGVAGNVYITAGALKNWTFDNTGKLTTPGNIALLNGDDATGSNSKTQVLFGYNGADDYQQYIRTRHNNAKVNNAIDFYTSDGTQNGTFPGNAILGGTVTQGAFQLAVYANATVRDSTITSPQPGMMIYVTGTGMQVRGATSWNTIAGSGT